MVLMVRGSESKSVFRLNGADENSATYALGWVLEQSPNFRLAMISAWMGKAVDVDDAVITLQKHGNDGGYTDIEVHSGLRFHAIMEAKRWWNVPTEEQLRRYQPRLAGGGALMQRLVSISSADAAFGRRRLPKRIEEAEIVHQSWGDVQRLAKQAHGDSTGFEEKLWLRHLTQHLQEFVAMERLTDNTVFVVSLGIQSMVEGGKHTWIDVVEKNGSYFHPVGDGWPVRPPNYIAFRYHGKLQSVHHIDSFEVVADLSTVNPLWLKTNSDHFVYRLGPSMAPLTEVRTGNIFRNGRVYCAIDTLLSGAFKTISEARDETKRRLNSSL
jgi:hypothetical protein